MSLLRKNSSINRHPLSGQVNEASNEVTHLTQDYNEIEVVPISKSQKCCDAVKKFLESISLGKYQTKLYNEGEAS